MQNNYFTHHYPPSLFPLSAAPEELNCPVGTYNPTLGIGAITDCTPCDAGWYCLEGISTPTAKCDEGFYCPTNITNVYAVTPALIGSYGPQQVIL